jgi:hypothetical protein
MAWRKTLSKLIKGQKKRNGTSFNFSLIVGIIETDVMLHLKFSPSNGIEDQTRVRDHGLIVAVTA